MVRDVVSRTAAAIVAVLVVAPIPAQTHLFRAEARAARAAAIPDDPSSLQASEQLHPLGRIGEPNEIASSMAWLLGPESAWMTGGILHLDGGMARVRTAAR